MFRKPRTASGMILCLTSALLIPGISLAPQPRIPPPAQKQGAGSQTIRVKVGLVQTDVMVFDKDGRFVPDLKLDQFELRVDGKVQPVSFLELVSMGSSYDEKIWARAEESPLPAAAPASLKRPADARTLLFFVDDWHLSAESTVRSREALSRLINTSMGPNDRVAVFAASGQIKPAQVLTNDKAALLAALEKFAFVSAGVEDHHWPPMTEGQAFLIEQGDEDVIAYFATVMSTTDSFTGIRRSPDSRIVRDIKDRASQLASVSAAIGERTLSALRELVRASAPVPGRKAIFFLSDGFVLQPQKSAIVEQLRQLTDAAARDGIIIYSLDTRGLVVGLPDAKSKQAADVYGHLAHSGYSEVLPQQDALNALASDTGGRFLKNTNALDAAMITTLTEISRYYMLGWYVDTDKLEPGRYSRIQASVKGRSGMTVRVRQGSLDLSKFVSTPQAKR